MEKTLNDLLNSWFYKTNIKDITWIQKTKWTNKNIKQEYRLYLNRWYIQIWFWLYKLLKEVWIKKIDCDESFMLNPETIKYPWEYSYIMYK